MISSFVLLCALYMANPVLFFDDFNDKELPGWRSDGHIGVKDGKLLLGNDADLLIEVRDALRWEDYTHAPFPILGEPRDFTLTYERA